MPIVLHHGRSLVHACCILTVASSIISQSAHPRKACSNNHLLHGAGPDTSLSCGPARAHSTPCGLTYKWSPSLAFLVRCAAGKFS